MIEIKDYSFSYNGGDKEITNINLSIKRGEFIVVTGPSGSGKTTIGRIINGLVPNFYEGETNGDIYIEGKSIIDYQVWQIGKTVASVFQDPNSQFFAHDVKDEIAFEAENYGMDPQIINNKIIDIAHKIRIKDLMRQSMFALSNGQKQKVAIASAIVAEPSVFVFDEPSANLDLKSTYELAKLMEKLQKQGHTIVVIEHRIYYLTHLLNRMIYIEDGRIRKEIKKEEVNALSKKDIESLGLRVHNFEAIDFTEKYNIEKSNKILEIDQISFSYGKKEVLRNLSFELSQGEIIALVGANGVGKTTLAQILCGLTKEKSGQIKFYRKRFTASKRKKYVDFIMNDSQCQLFSESVEEELLLGFSDKKDSERILKKFGLWESRKKHPASLSGGQKQRLTLALSEKKDRDIMIFDEPTSGLDGENMRIAAEYFKEQAQKGKGIFIITHDYEFILQCCNKVIVISDRDIKKEIKVCNENKNRILKEMLYC